MKMKIIQAGDTAIAEIMSDEIILQTPQDALDLMASVPVSNIIIYEKNVSDNFFDLKTGVAGEILLKFTNYRVKLAIIGDFKKFPGKALQDFIYESNKHRDYLFVDSVESVKKSWTS